jgi:LemA protein
MTVAVAAGVVVLALGAVWAINNSLVAKAATVDQQWAQVQTTLQRRADLVPNLVATVRGYAEHEKEIFTSVADARARLAGARTPAEASAADSELSGTLSRLLAIAERYPDLKANQSFLALQDELAGTENRIAVARKRYNDAVRDYNVAVRRFPSILVAIPLGFEERQYFVAAASAQSAPSVDFGP